MNVLKIILYYIIPFFKTFIVNPYLIYRYFPKNIEEPVSSGRDAAFHEIGIIFDICFCVALFIEIFVGVCALIRLLKKEKAVKVLKYVIGSIGILWGVLNFLTFYDLHEFFLFMFFPFFLGLAMAFIGYICLLFNRGGLPAVIILGISSVLIISPVLYEIICNFAISWILPIVIYPPFCIYNIAFRRKKIKE